jgi:hypothetical protein
MVIARMRSGFAVIGDTQHLPGSSLLLAADCAADHLTIRLGEGREVFDLS